MVLELKADRIMVENSRQPDRDGVALETVCVDQFVAGLLDPNRPMLGPVRDGGHIVANVANVANMAPGCWGPVITPEIRSGRAVTRPVAVAGAEVGDAIAIRIKDIAVASPAAAAGHMDLAAVRAGVIWICPVEVSGGGIHLGHMDVLRGDDEIAGHPCDTSGTVTLQVHVLKGLALEGALLFPVLEDLPFMARPLSAAERERALVVAKARGVAYIEESAPIAVIGTGPDLAAAADNGLNRAAALLEMTVPEVKNRATMTGAIVVGRRPDLIQVTFQAPLDRLERLGLAPFVRDQYGIGWSG